MCFREEKQIWKLGAELRERYEQLNPWKEIKKSMKRDEGRYVIKENGWKLKIEWNKSNQNLIPWEPMRFIRKGKFEWCLKVVWESGGGLVGQKDWTIETRRWRGGWPWKPHAHTPFRCRVHTMAQLRRLHTIPVLIPLFQDHNCTQFLLFDKHTE